MQAMSEREASRQLGGVVQLDDACLGGSAMAAKPVAIRRTSTLSRSPSRPLKTAVRDMP